MPTPRLFRRATTVVALAGLLVLAVAAATGQPDKKDIPLKAQSLNNILIDAGLNDYDSNPYPYTLKAEYVASEDGLEAAVIYNGKAVAPKDAPQSGGSLTFTLDFAGDTTGENVEVQLRSKATPTDVKASDMRYGLTFIGGGMMWAEPFKFDVPKDAQLAEKAKKAGDPISAGFHHGHFPAYASPVLGAQARMWVQGQFKPIPDPNDKTKTIRVPLKTDYDLPAGLVWQPRNGKWYPCWAVVLPEALKAEPLKPDGEVPRTVVRVLLLNHKGKVLHIMTYPH